MEPDAPTQRDADLSLPKLIAAARTGRGWSQEQAAAHFGMGQPAYGRWESGENKPRTAILPKVADFVGLPVGVVQALKSGVGIDDQVKWVSLMALVESNAKETAQLALQVSQLAAQVDTLAAQLVAEAGTKPARVSGTYTPA